MNDIVKVFVAGGTGYIGSHLLPRLIARDHRVFALTRPAARAKVAIGAQAVFGDALDPNSYQTQIPRDCTFVHLVGVAHPGPAKAAQFISVDLASVRASLSAARNAGAQHFVYISVAQPAPVMQAYIAARQAAETLIRASGIPATILRPWYVLGPGHRWPIVLRPLYWLAERLPPTKRTAQRLGLIKLDRFVDALVRAVELPAPKESRVLEAPAIRRLAF